VSDPIADPNDSWPDSMEVEVADSGDADDERGVCMNCGASMDYSPMRPWCVECDEAEEE
jgi:hypothetical protein